MVMLKRPIKEFTDNEKTTSKAVKEILKITQSMYPYLNSLL